MKGRDLDMSGNVWIYKPPLHKTTHHGHDRTIYLGPKAQDVVRPFLQTNIDAYLFSPAEAEESRRSKQSAERKTPISCGNRPGTNRRRKAQRAPGDRYTVGSYRRAIAHAC